MGMEIRLYDLYGDQALIAPIKQLQTLVKISSIFPTVPIKLNN